jgi:hypothetical protein
VGATVNVKEIQPGLVQNKFDLFGSNFAYFLLVSNIGVAQTKESTESFRITSPFGW